MEPLITKYRPQALSEVIGHKSILKGLSKAINSQTRPHSYLFTGPAGVGKTTLARIVAKAVNAEVLEVDAAANSGVDSVRELIELGNHRPLTADAKMIICNEVQRFSRAAFDTLLMTVEEPPSYLYIALTTTELNKVPDALVSRCYHVSLSPLKDPEIYELLDIVCSVEKWKVDQDILRLVVNAATGQPRKALSILQTCHDAPSLEEAKRIVKLQSDDDAPVIRLLSSLIKGAPWSSIRDDLKAVLEEEDIEASFALAGRYLMGIVLKSDEKRARGISSIIESLVHPTSTYDRKLAFVASITRYLWS